MQCLQWAMMTFIRQDMNPWWRIHLALQKKKLLAYSFEEEEGEEGEQEEEEEEEVVEEGEKKPSSLSGKDFMLFILPPIRSVNDFIPKMTKDVFHRLYPRF